LQKAGLGQEVEVSNVTVDEQTGEARSAAASRKPAFGQAPDAQASIRSSIRLQ
jgi:hypothetical protein